jgi:hypothetical protein
MPADDFTSFADRDFGPNFNQFKITYGRDLEFIGDTLFDTRTFTSASTVQLAFFSSAQTEDLTNLDLGNMIPDKQGFLVMSVRVFVKIPPRSQARTASATTQTGATNDLFQILSTGRLEFNFLNKDYGTFPLWLLPSGGGVVPTWAAEGATADPGGIIDFANNGIADARNMYVMEQPLFLPPMTKLGVLMKWPAAITLAAGNPAIVLAFDGLMVRPVQ